MTFKVGDKVRATHQAALYFKDGGWMNTTDIGVVVETGRDGFVRTVFKDNPKAPSSFPFRPDELVLANEPKRDLSEALMDILFDFQFSAGDFGPLNNTVARRVLAVEKIAALLS